MTKNIPILEYRWVKPVFIIKIKVDTVKTNHKNREMEIIESHVWNLVTDAGLLEEIEVGWVAMKRISITDERKARYPKRSVSF